ncbi:hypothetical protein pb186bvf_018086 [Paramecium bursaria]
MFSMFACCSKKKKIERQLPKRHQLQLIQSDGLYFDKNLRIITEFNNLKQCEIVTNICKYYCPICFRYSDCMLNSTCCSNYICHLCAIQSIKNKMLACHFCRDHKCKYIDVDPSQEIKRYSDSQTHL